MGIRKISVATGIDWVEVPEAGLYLLCGCPADAVKHLMKTGLIQTEDRGGVVCETGPNAILLSDTFLQGERFANLAEFPVLQMLYRQGLILPGHPNNTGTKPLLVGTEDQVRAQVEYIHRGNYGLTSVEEITAAGIAEPEARAMMRMKLRFAFGRIREPEELLETRVVNGKEPVEIRNGVTVSRLALNRYRVAYRNEAVEVDLSLPRDQDHEPPYPLACHDVRREYFAVIHSGEGDGWDVNRPCMSSILTFQGRIYLIDTGPNILHSLQALGISVNEIEGVFQTHAHDDHFNGLGILMRADHRLKYFATPLVRSSVVRKLAALTGVGEARFARYFDIHDLTPNSWNNVDGLEVRPVHAPHPVETAVLFFRALWDTGYRTYAHLADTTSLEVLERMVTDGDEEPGVSRAEYERVVREYRTKVDVKKVDIGGGLIHGNAEDFRGDRSGRVVLSHTALRLTDLQKEVGDSVPFGTMDVLIAADHDYSKSVAVRHLRAFFPTTPEYELHALLNCPVATFSPGSLIIRKSEENEGIHLILSGVLEFIVPELGVRNILTSGSLVGELSGLLGTASRGSYRALSVVKSVCINRSLYVTMARRNGLLQSLRKSIDLRTFLQNTWILGERLSCPTKNRIARTMVSVSYVEDETAPPLDSRSLLVVREGQIGVYVGDQLVDRVGPGGFAGEEGVLFERPTGRLACRAITPTQGYLVPAASLEGVPIVQWKLLEALERRTRGGGLTWQAPSL
jgi:hemerythrin